MSEKVDYRKLFIDKLAQDFKNNMGYKFDYLKVHKGFLVLANYDKEFIDFYLENVEGHATYEEWCGEVRNLILEIETEKHLENEGENK